MLNGRIKIYTDTYDITSKNVVQELNKALVYHGQNESEEDYLWNYYRGVVPVLTKKKVYRREINSKVHENRGMQIVEFYQGYIFGEPIKYIRRGNDESLNDEIEWLNAVMDSKSKISLDGELAEKMLVMGVCPRLVLPDKEKVFNMYSLDPRFAFNVYYNGLGGKTRMSVTFVVDENMNITYSVYTDKEYFVIKNGAIVHSEPHTMGVCPMIEYSLNNVRMGIFEPVVSLLDAIDDLQSNRLDDIKQFVNSILTIMGAEISDETMERLKVWGALSLPEGTNAKYLTSNLSQNDIQTLKKDLLSAVTDITGMPDRNQGGSTGDTGSAIILRDGWQIADAKSKGIEILFKKSEREMLEIILHIAKVNNVVDLSNDFVEIRFTRRNYENIQTKAQVLTTMLGCEKIAPELAFTHSGMFSDPLLAYEMSQKYYDERNKMSTLPQTIA